MFCKNVQGEEKARTKAEVEASLEGFSNKTDNVAHYRWIQQASYSTSNAWRSHLPFLITMSKDVLLINALDWTPIEPHLKQVCYLIV